MPKVVLHDVGLLAFLTASKLACSGPTSDKIVVFVVTFVKYCAIHSKIVQVSKYLLEAFLQVTKLLLLL